MPKTPANELGRQLIERLRKMVDEGNGDNLPTRRQIDYEILTAILVILDTQNRIIEKLDIMNGSVKVAKERTDKVPKIIWEIFDRPKVFLSIVIFLFLLISAFYVKESRDAILAFLF